MRNLNELHRNYEEYDPEKVEQKSKEFLRSVMGNEKFDRLQKDGKIEIETDNKKYGKNIYELYHDGRIINRTKDQSYCIVPDRLDYPNDDIVAIKYAWLTHRSDIAEKVANKTNLHANNRGVVVNSSRITTGYADFVRDMEQRGWNRQSIVIGSSPYYGDYVDYLSTNGWSRELITISELDTNIVDIRGVRKDNTGCVIDITCPPGRKMTLMGRAQTPRGTDPNTAYSLGLYITDKNGEEIPDYTKIRIAKVKPSEDVIQLARIYYSDIKMRNEKAMYSFTHGIELNGEVHLSIYIVDSKSDISSKNIKFNIETDFWTRNA